MAKESIQYSVTSLIQQTESTLLAAFLTAYSFARTEHSMHPFDESTVAASCPILWKLNSPIVNEALIRNVSTIILFSINN